MAFKLVYHSQQDPQWKSDTLGFGDPGDCRLCAQPDLA